MAKTFDIQDAPVFSYPLASGDMRYITIGEREIYLRNDPELGIVFRGEIQGCGSECFIELNEILLEYAMSCEGCREKNVAAEEVFCFGEHLAKILIESTSEEAKGLPVELKLTNTFRYLLNSMSSKYVETLGKDRLEYSLDCCPLRECAKNTGLNRSIEMAQISFVAICKYLLNSLAPGWKLLEPLEDGDMPIHKIVIAA